MVRREIRSGRGWKMSPFVRQSAFTLTLFVGLYGGCNMLYTGSPIPLAHIEHLQNPVTVAGWTEDGLELADGRRVMPA